MKDFGMVSIDGKRLAEELNKRGLSKSGVSRDLGYSENFVSKIVSRGTASKKALVTIESVYGIPMADIITGGAVVSMGNAEATEAPKQVAQIDYDMLYETIKRAMIDALNG